MVTDGQVRRLLPRTRLGNVLGLGGWENRHESQNGPTLSRPARAAEHAEEVQGPRTYRTRLDPFAAVWPEVEERLAGRAAAARQDALRLAAADASGPVPRFASPHLRTSRAAVAGDPRTGQVRHVPPGPRGRRSRGVRLHAHERAEHHRCRPALRSHGLPFRADLLELGVGDAVCVGVVRGLG